MAKLLSATERERLLASALDLLTAVAASDLQVGGQPASVAADLAGQVQASLEFRLSPE